VVTNFLLAYFVVTTTALVVYILWRRDGEVALLRQQNAALLETIFLAGNLPVVPALREGQSKAQPAVATQASSREEELSARDWERSLGNMDKQAYDMFKREAYETQGLRDPDEVFEFYKATHGLQAPYSVMRL
jgi:hypothetical protein